MAPVYPVGTGHPVYSGNFIPEIWSGKLIENFYDTTVLGAIANTDYEGDIANMGDTVHIRTTPKVTIRSYVKGQSLETERPDSPPIELLIDQGEYFSCVIDDIDTKQMDLAMMNEWGMDASKEMAIHIDTKVLAGMLPDIGRFNKGANAGRISANYNMGTASSPRVINAIDNSYGNADDATSFLIDVCSVLEEANAPMDKWIVIPSALANMLKKGDIRRADITGDGSNTLRNGMIGSIDGLTIYVSHLLASSGTGNNKIYDVVAGHRMGLTFASQLTKTETLRSEKTFGDVLRGLQVYGYKVVKPEALLHAKIQVSQAAPS